MYGNDYISAFYKKVVESLELNEKISPKTIRLKDVDQKYLSIFLSYQFKKR